MTIIGSSILPSNVSWTSSSLGSLAVSGSKAWLGHVKLGESEDWFGPAMVCIIFIYFCWRKCSDIFSGLNCIPSVSPGLDTLNKHLEVSLPSSTIAPKFNMTCVDIHLYLDILYLPVVTRALLSSTTLTLSALGEQKLSKQTKRNNS